MSLKETPTIYHLYFSLKNTELVPLLRPLLLDISLLHVTLVCLWGAVGTGPSVLVHCRQASKGQPPLGGPRSLALSPV
jgi:hypothetical protein